MSNSDRLRDKFCGFTNENIFNSVSDYVSIHDRNFGIVKANAALCKLLDKSEEELVGQRCYKIFHNRDSEWSTCPHAMMMDKRRPVTELVEDTRIGTPLLVTCSPVYDEDNVVLGSVHIARDVSIERNREKAQQELISELSEVLSKLHQLSDIITICSSCRHVCNNEGSWMSFEKYLADNFQMLFSHSICPDCMRELYPDYDGV